MSHDLRLVKGKAKKPVAIRVGGIPQYGGTIAYNPETQRVCDVEEVCFNVTYNYGCILDIPDVLGEDGIRSLYGQPFETILDRLYRARDTIARTFADKLDVDQLSGKVVTEYDYWKATPRNVMKTLDHMILVLNVVRTQERSCTGMTFEGD